jgi:hypothetical protein
VPRPVRGTDREPEPEIEAKAETEAEPDTEHEEISNQAREAFGLQHEVNPIVLDRMNRLAEIVMRGSEATEDNRGRSYRFEIQMSEEDEEAMATDLEALLAEFEGNEIPLDQCGEVSLRDPVI